MRRTLTALGFLLVAAAAACDDGAPPTPTNGLDAATAQRLFERLDRLVAALESTTRAGAPAGETATNPPARTLVADATSDLVARLDALENEVARLKDRSGMPGPIARVTAMPPMEPVAVQQYAVQLQSEDQAVRQEARRSLFQLSEQQILQRLGTPTYTGIADGGHVSWSYDSGESHLNLIFVNGRVVVIN